MSETKKAEAAILGLLGDLDDAGIKTLEQDLPITKKIIESMPIDTKNNHPKSIKNSESLANIATDRCRLWEHADRNDFEMGDIQALALSISQHGQQEPALVRRIKDMGDGVEYEVIFGNRRWKACTLINKPLKAIVRSLSNADAAIAQQEENKNREGISDYSRALHYKSLLDSSVFSSVKELSEKMGISRVALTDILSYTRIPDNIMIALQEPHKISKKMAAKISGIASSKDEEKIAALIHLAPDITDGKISLRSLETKIDQIINKIDPNKIKKETFVSTAGVPLFTSFMDKQGHKKILIKNTVATKCNDNQLEHLIKEYLERLL